MRIHARICAFMRTYAHTGAGAYLRVALRNDAHDIIQAPYSPVASASYMHVVCIAFSLDRLAAAGWLAG